MTDANRRQQKHDGHLAAIPALHWFDRLRSDRVEQKSTFNRVEEFTKRIPLEEEFTDVMEESGARSLCGNHAGYVGARNNAGKRGFGTKNRQ
ncbi:MAG: hypothetical protein O7I42_21555 [Alphaproteobacteria bacterium]|nr:hypothetical protein [Alphaproteobacteria bacterium]